MLRHIIQIYLYNDRPVTDAVLPASASFLQLACHRGMPALMTHAHTLEMSTYPVWVCTKSVQQELILVPEERGKHHQVQAVSPLSQLCGLGGVVEVVIGHQERLVRADGCCIAADVGQPINDKALLQYAGFVGAQLLHERDRCPAAHSHMLMRCCCTLLLYVEWPNGIGFACLFSLLMGHCCTLLAGPQTCMYQSSNGSQHHSQSI